jgi:PIN domain nuclease of toxin-antitoxin system
MSAVLLDTHVFLFLNDAIERVPQDVRRAIDRADRRYLSAASAWEMAIKLAMGRLQLPEPLERYLPSRTSRLMLQTLPISDRHAIRAGALPLLHRDPFDRMLVAQSLEEDLLLVTLDPRVSQYGARTLGVTKGKRRVVRPR